MKKNLTLLLAVASLALAGYSQDTNTPAPNLKAHLIAFAQDVKQSKSITVAVYPTFAPDIVVNGVKKQWGAGVALLCPASVIPALDGTFVGNHAYGGLRFDLLGGEAFGSTVAVGIKSDFQIYGHNFTIFGESGANFPITGFGTHNIELGASIGTGVHTSIYSFGKPDADGHKPGNVNVFFAVEKWTQFSGMEYHPGIAGTWSF